MMDTIKKTAEVENMRVRLSTLWIFAVLNYLYADVFTSFFDPAAQEETAKLTGGAVLGWAVIMETAIAMVLLSRILKYGANRRANIVVGLLHTVTVSWSLSVGAQPPFYMFFAAIEIACTLFIVWCAWKWANPENILDSKV